MSVDQSALRSRRAILTSALGGLGAVVAAKLANPVGVSATPGEPVLADADNTGVGTTSVTSSTTAAALAGESTLGAGLRGDSTSATGSTFGDPSDRAGVIGIGGSAVDKAPNTDETGVYGFSNISESSTGVWGDSFIGSGVYGTGSTGVLGQGDTGVMGEGSYGVYGIGRQAVTGDAAPGETGIYGFVGGTAAPLPPASVAVQATSASTSYIALNVTGKAKFSRSGRTYVATNASSRKITMAGVTTASYIIATLQTRRTGVYVHAVVPAAGSFTIYLNKAVTATTYVGYLVIN